MLASPTFTGTPLAPTAIAGTSTTQIATTAFVSTAVSNIANEIPPPTGVSAGTYSNAQVTVNEYGQVTSIRAGLDPLLAQFIFG
jgi:hypothetical protein